MSVTRSPAMVTSQKTLDTPIVIKDGAEQPADDLHANLLLRGESVPELSTPPRNMADLVNDDIISTIRKPQLPAFIKDRPDIWFFLIEAEFIASRIRSDETKYNATIRALDVETLQQITDVLYNPPTQDKYLHLKRIITQRLTDSRQKQIQRLLNDLTLADKKPSQLLREMRDLAAGGIQDEMLHTLWVNRLPTHIRPLLIVSDTLDLNALAEIADRIMDATNQSYVMSTTTRTAERKDGNIDFQRLEKRIDDLQQALATCLKEVATLKTRSVSRGRSRTKTPERSGICYYHNKFGAQARRCLLPCNYSEAASLGN